MTKKDLICRVTETLRENNIRKPITVPRHIFHLSDDEGNKKDFIVKKTDKTAAYNIEDVATILDTCVSIIEESIKRGEEVNLRGFGTLSVHKRAAGRTKHPQTGEIVEVESRYLPKFCYGKDLRMAAKIYELSLDDGKEESSPDCKDEGADY